MSDVSCARMHCPAERSHILTDHPFAQTKQHLVWCRFHNNKEMEMAVLKWLNMQQPNFYTTEFLNSYQDEINPPECLQIMIKKL